MCFQPLNPYSPFGITCFLVAEKILVPVSVTFVCIVKHFAKLKLNGRSKLRPTIRSDRFRHSKTRNPGES